MQFTTNKAELRKAVMRVSAMLPASISAIRRKTTARPRSWSKRSSRATGEFVRRDRPAISISMAYLVRVPADVTAPGAFLADTKAIKTALKGGKAKDPATIPHHRRGHGGVSRRTV